MRRLWILVCLLASPGCMTDADKKQFDAAMRDGAGDNMKMRGDSLRLDDSTDMPSLRSRD